MRAILLIAVFLIQLSDCYRFAWRPDTKVFPYNEIPPPSVIDNGDNDGKPYNDIITRTRLETILDKCIFAWQGDGKCNADNNKIECQFDSGDCCINSCKKNCQEIDEFGNDITNITFAIKRKEDRPCPFQCGVLQYNCLAKDQGCYQCNTTNGECKSQPDCFADETHQSMFDILDSCQALDWSMGNLATINQYCGQDPFFQVVHDSNDRRMHFLGCGIPESQCTKRPCCLDAQNYGFNSTNCGTEERQYEFFDPVTYAYKNKTTSCIAHFTDCFQDNYRTKGQCCQCKRGWTGFDCNQAVCFMNKVTHKRSGCMHGHCYGPDKCACEEGWKGEQCNQGICMNCVNGFCLGPEYCSCFYGWEGPNCTDAVSYPSCLNGVPIRPDFCQCDDGWQGRACDVPVCIYGCGHGYCKDAFTCECEPGWFSTDITKQCDARRCSETSPMCKTCLQVEPFTCLTCAYSHYLSSTDNQCYRCELKYPHCWECNENQCLKCDYPYFIDPDTLHCVSYGIFETAQDQIFVDESWLYFDVRIIRMYHSFINPFTSSNKILNDPTAMETSVIDEKDVEIDWDLVPNYFSPEEPRNIRIQQDRGRLIFKPDETEKSVYFRIYKRQYYEENPELTKFIFRLRWGQKHGEFKYDAKTTEIFYFDSDPENSEMNDAHHTKTFFGPNNKILDNNKALVNRIGIEYFFNVYSYFAKDKPKSNYHLDKFFLIIKHELPDPLPDWMPNQVSQQDVYMSEHDKEKDENMYRIRYTVKKSMAKEIWIYSACSGITATYWPSTLDKQKVLTHRVEPYLPYKMDPLINQLVFFSARFEFVLKATTSQFYISVNTGATANVTVNGIHYVVMPDNGNVDTVNCGQNRMQIIDQYTEQQLTTGCCRGGTDQYLFPIQLNYTQQYLHFVVDYKHSDSNFRQQSISQPCVLLLSNTKLPIFSDTYALTNLKGSPYLIEPEINQDLISTFDSFVTMQSFIDNNTMIEYTSLNNLTFQAGQTHIFKFDFFDIYGNKINPNVVLKPKFQIRLIHQDGLSSYSTESYMNYTAMQNYFKIETQRATTRNGWAYLHITLNGKHLRGSPFGRIKVLPGVYDLSNSPLIENNLLSSYINNPLQFKRPRCYVGDRCTLQLTLRDKFGNLVNDRLGILKIKNTITMLQLGPYDNIDGYIANQTYTSDVQELNQHFPENPELYFFDMTIYRVGIWRFYIRDRRHNVWQKAQQYPIEISVYSDIASRLNCTIYETMFYVNSNSVKVQVKDKYNNTLTDYGVKLRVQVKYTDPLPEEYIEAGEYSLWDEQDYFSMVSHSTYEMYIFPTIKGNYDLIIYICEELNNACGEIEDEPEKYKPVYRYIKVYNEITKKNETFAVESKNIYLTSQFPSPSKSVAFGVGLSRASVAKRESFVVSVRDKNGNIFDAASDNIHISGTIDQYIRCELKTWQYEDPNDENTPLIEYIWPVELDFVVPEQGLYRYRYQIMETFISAALAIKIMDSEPVYIAALKGGIPQNELKLIDYTALSEYKNIPGSPFVPGMSTADPSVITDYKTDMLFGGFAMFSTSSIQQPEKERLPVNQVFAEEEFQVPIRTANYFNVLIDYKDFQEAFVDTEPNYMIKVDAVSDDNNCIAGSSTSRLNRYCRFWVHSKKECELYKMCEWIPNELTPRQNAFGNQDLFSCVDCSSVRQVEDFPGNVQLIRLEKSIYTEYYEATFKIKKPGHYKFMASLMQIGTLRLNLYENPDYTYFASEQRVVVDQNKNGGGMNVTFDGNFSSFFDNQAQYSMVMQGALRFDNSTYYNLTFQTNLKFEFYMDGQLLLSKDNLQKQTLSIIDISLVKDVLYDVEILLVNDDVYQEKKSYTEKDPIKQAELDEYNRKDIREERELGYFQMFETTPYIETRIIMPKNMFQVVHVNNNLNVGVQVV